MRLPHRETMILMIYRSNYFFLFLLLISSGINAQVITQISTAWDDRLDEWIIYTDDEEVEGTLEPKWRLGNDISAWEYTLGDLTSGDIKQEWESNPNSWIVITESGDRIVAKTIWRNDFTEWEIKTNSNSYRFKTEYKGNPNHWLISQSDEEEFHITMDRNYDPRDWFVEDFIEEGSYDLTITISFIAIINSLTAR